MGASLRRFWRLAVAVKYNVAQLLKAAVGESRQYELSEDISGIDPTPDVAGPLVGRVRFLRTSEGVLVTGRLRVQVRANCRRCLQDLVLPVEVHLEEEYRPSVDVVTGTPLPQDEGEDTVTMIDAQHYLDLTEVVRQNLLLAMPLSALCDALCRGICPGCGANLNTERCSCELEETDPRLEALRDLL